MGIWSAKLLFIFDMFVGLARVAGNFFSWHLLILVVGGCSGPCFGWAV